MSDMEKLRCNARIAVALLDVLASAGDAAARARALHAAGLEAATLRVPGAWISEEALASMLRSVPVDRKLARRVGRQLVTPDGMGLLLCYGGVATPEKAYRRSDQVLARECEGGSYETLEISGERAQIAFHPGPRVGLARQRAPRDWEIEMCGVREGMLEAVPMLFGLIPAKVRETQCAAQGAGYCRFEVSWKRSPRHGLVVGAGFGALAGVGFALSFWSLAPLWLLAPASLGLAAVCVVAGRSLDLARQLEAVAGARRGQLALLDQADRSLAEKMDELAKIGATLDSAAASRSGGSLPGLRDALARRAGEGDPIEAGPEVATRVAGQIHETLGGLQSRLGELHRRLTGEGSEDEGCGELEALVDGCVGDARRIQEIGAELARSADQAGAQRREAFDLSEIVGRAVDGVRLSFGTSLELGADLAKGLPMLRCEPFQMEQVADQLLRNAAEANEGRGRVRVSLRGSDDGLELVVEDEGQGIEPDDLDRAFDPFSSGEAGEGEGDDRGLAFCYRVVEEHGGELRIATEAGGGTRVTVLLPPNFGRGGEPDEDLPAGDEASR